MTSASGGIIIREFCFSITHHFPFLYTLNSISRKQNLIVFPLSRDGVAVGGQLLARETAVRGVAAI